MRHQIPSFQQWRPNSRKDILDHYYANSDGASLPSWFTSIQNFATSVGAAIANAFVPGSGKLVSEMKVMDFQNKVISDEMVKDSNNTGKRKQNFKLGRWTISKFSYRSIFSTVSHKIICVPWSEFTQLSCR